MVLPSLILLLARLAFAEGPAPAPAPAPAALPPLRAEDVNAAAKGAIYRLDTMVGNTKVEILHGTAFVVDPSGLLLTNYHVVREFLLRGSDRKLVLEVDHAPMAATVRAVDVLNDLAVVHVEKLFPTALPLSSGASPNEGEVVYSFGFPANALTHVQGSFGGEKPQGFVTAGLAALALSSGMSGGPLLNGRAEVVGVNRAAVRDAQNLSFFSPLQAVRSLVDRGRSPASLDNWKREAVESIRRQESIGLAQAGGGETVQEGSFSFALPAPSQNCAQTKSEEGASTKAQEARQCRSGGFSPLVGASNALDVRTLVLANNSPLAAVNSSLTEQLLPGLYAREKISLAPPANQPAPSAALERCQMRNLKNAQGLDMAVSYCMMTNGFYPGLYSTFVRVEVVSGIHHLSLAQVYQGFSADTTAELLARFLDSVRLGGSS